MKYTIANLQKEFGTEKQCLNYLFNKRFTNHTCPKCHKAGNYYKVTGRKVFACSCGKDQICPTADTIFHKSKTPLALWFYAIFLMSQAKNGVSAKELERHLGVTYKTAWRMAKQIRQLMSDGGDMFSGTVEMDETYVGGKGRHSDKKGRGRSLDKTPIVGMVERGGNVVARVAPDVSAHSLLALLKLNVEKDTRVVTDSFKSYHRVEEKGFKHDIINHSHEFVRGDVHTNTIEGFWGQLKRGLNGTYHQVSSKYLQDYVNEFAFRFNYRNSDRHQFLVLSERL